MDFLFEKSRKVPKHRCTKCFKEMDHLTGDGIPTVGSLIACINCGHIMMIGESFKMLEVDIPQLARESDIKDYCKICLASKVLANVFHKRNGYYASTIFEDIEKHCPGGCHWIEGTGQGLYN